MIELFRKNLEGSGLISKTDLTLMRHFQHAEPAAEELVHFYSNYVSSRFFRDQYLIRLRKPVTDEMLQKISVDFKDVLAKGQFERFKEIEQDDDNNPSLERVLFYFDRSSYSRLRQLIDFFNSL